MNIFIYGNQNFKNEVHKILLNSKIETILEDVKIEDISNIDILKENIAKNPDDIYLIDEDNSYSMFWRDNAELFMDVTKNNDVSLHNVGMISETNNFFKFTFNNKERR